MLALTLIWFPKGPDHQTIQGSNADPKRSATIIAPPQGAEERIADYTWWLSFFTLALVVVSVVQFKFLISADRIANLSALSARDNAKFAANAAMAAKRSADAAIMIELPIFTTSGFDAGKGVPKWAINFNNNGRSPAILLADCLVAKLGWELPSVPRYPLADIRHLEFDFIALPGEKFSVVRPTTVNDPAWDEILNGRQCLWFYGYVEYLDFMKCKRREGFCFRFVPKPNVLYATMAPDHGEFVRAGPSTYTYGRIIGEGESAPTGL